ncbi:MAG: hypothetical protein IJX39_05130 [Clostridia bacterium]|nr:hypothetical protein [Clostridia bacterium]
MMRRHTRPIRFGLVFFGLFFFFNPYFAVIDVLPDFIGCLLICAGLSRAALIHPDMKTARTAFLKVAAVDVLENLSLMVIFGMGSGAEQPTSLLIAAFGAAVLELMFLVPAVRALFDGFLALSTTHDCVALYGNSYGGVSYIDGVSRLTLIFLFFREVVCLLPEFTSLTTSSYSDSAFNRIYDYIGLMRVFACILVTLAGLYWLIRLLGFYRRLRREENMLVALGEQHRAYYDAHPGIAVEHRYGWSFLLLILGVFLLTDFYLDFSNIFPDYLAAALILGGVLISDADRKYRICTAVAACVYGIISAVSGRFSYDFVNQYSAGEIAKNAEASQAYFQMWMMALVEFLVFLVLLASLLLMLRAVIKKWAGYRAHYESEFETRCHRDLLAEFDGQLIRCFVFGFISGLLSFLYDYIKELPGEGFLHVLEFTWIFDFCGAVLFAVLFTSLLSNIYSEIKNRFLYD